MVCRRENEKINILWENSLLFQNITSEISKTVIENHIDRKPYKFVIWNNMG